MGKGAEICPDVAEIKEKKEGEAMHRIGVISDTHGLLREEVKEELKRCDVILHGGDIHKEQILKELEAIGKLYVVRGNADKEWAAHLPATLHIELFGIRITMIHNRKELSSGRAVLKDTDLVIYGHSHKYEDKAEGNIRYLNPGSCGPRRFYQPITMAVIEAGEDGSCEIRRIDIVHEAYAQNDRFPEREQDRRKLVQAVIRGVEKNKSVADIARDNRISEEFAEQICRMYLTHPGVDVDGILNRIS